MVKERDVMTTTDTSAEAVEQVIYQMLHLPADGLAHQTTRDDFAAMLRALRAERDEAIQRGNDWCDQARKLRGERDRLGAALREIVQQCFEHEGRANIAATARAALKETGHE
jgi:uncharacterized coiled-coil DUF342 family protein